METQMKPVVNGRASICTWELEFYFRDNTQIREFVKLLMEDEIDFDFEYEKVLDETSELHYITVKGSWANNLVRVAKMAKKVDYKYG
jgi:hypothetical protein